MNFNLNRARAGPAAGRSPVGRPPEEATFFAEESSKFLEGSGLGLDVVTSAASRAADINNPFAKVGGKENVDEIANDAATYWARFQRSVSLQFNSPNYSAATQIGKNCSKTSAVVTHNHVNDTTTPLLTDHKRKSIGEKQGDSDDSQTCGAMFGDDKFRRTSTIDISLEETRRGEGRAEDDLLNNILGNEVYVIVRHSECSRRAIGRADDNDEEEKRQQRGRRKKKQTAIIMTIVIVILGTSLACFFGFMGGGSGDVNEKHKSGNDQQTAEIQIENISDDDMRSDLAEEDFHADKKLGSGTNNPKTTTRDKAYLVAKVGALVALVIMAAPAVVVHFFAATKKRLLKLGARVESEEETRQEIERPTRERETRQEIERPTRERETRQEIERPTRKDKIRLGKIRTTSEEKKESALTAEEMAQRFPLMDLTYLDPGSKKGDTRKIRRYPIRKNCDHFSKSSPEYSKWRQSLRSYSQASTVNHTQVGGTCYANSFASLFTSAGLVADSDRKYLVDAIVRMNILRKKYNREFERLEQQISDPDSLVQHVLSYIKDVSSTECQDDTREGPDNDSIGGDTSSILLWVVEHRETLLKMYTDVWIQEDSKRSWAQQEYDALWKTLLSPDLDQALREHVWASKVMDPNDPLKIEYTIATKENNGETKRVVKMRTDQKAADLFESKPPLLLQRPLRLCKFDENAKLGPQQALDILPLDFCSNSLLGKVEVFRSERNHMDPDKQKENRSTDRLVTSAALENWDRYEVTRSVKVGANQKDTSHQPVEVKFTDKNENGPMDVSLDARIFWSDWREPPNDYAVGTLEHYVMAVCQFRNGHSATPLILIKDSNRIAHDSVFSIFNLAGYASHLAHQARSRESNAEHHVLHDRIELLSPFNLEKYLVQLIPRFTTAVGEKDTRTDNHGNQYTGPFLNGHYHGRGEMQYEESGNKYLGNFRDGVQHGSGVLDLKKEGKQYSGEWFHGRRTLDGVYTKNGATESDKEWEYRGSFKDTKGFVPDGQGVETLRDGEKYDGVWQNGKKHGRGVLTWGKGGKYDGQWQDGKWHGQGFCIWLSGQNYDGEWQADKRHGRGVCIWPSGNEYNGEWQVDKMHGQGVKTWRNGDKYNGQWQGGKMHGQGVKTWGDDDKYNGQWQDDKKHGRGVLTWGEDGKYEGQWQDDKWHGSGVCIWPSGQNYEGEWQAGKRHGRGVCIWASGNEYDGEWQVDKMHGQGVKTWENGQKYNGQWQGGKMHGQGVKTWENGQKYNGELQAGKRHGWGVLTWGTGHKYEGEYQDDKKHGQGTLFKGQEVVDKGRWVNGKKVS